ncbi:DUF4192 domain-containing protein [Corynebacterium mayonis]|uniref:DUF4192 domain-containing protein n=1 Tax=Corynebacterium mayonis TaxID=3062461 RepID=UPI0031401A2C
MDTNYDTHDNLTGPSEIIASLPGILGFYPQESVVLLGLCPTEDSSRVVLGPVLRVDLSHAANLCADIHLLPLGDCVFFFAVVITKIPDSLLATQAIDALYEAGRTCAVPLINACWHVSEISTGTPYKVIFGSEVGVIPPAWRQEWIGGTVSSVMASPAMRPLHENGALPELEREDTFRFFDRLDPANEEEAENQNWLQNLAQMRASEMWRRIKGGDRDLKQVVEDVCALLHSGQPRPILSPWDQTQRGALRGEEDELFQLATLLSRSLLRDALMHDALHAPLTAARLFLGIAKTYTGLIRANSLCLWAIIAADRGLTTWAVAALVCAQEEVAGHTLSEMLVTLIHSGKAKEFLEFVRVAPLDVWADLN